MARPIVIAHVSDLHCGSSYFIPSLAMRVVDELNELGPDVVVVTGDLTDAGYRGEYTTACALIDRIACERKLVMPGNHDARNVGDVHFEELFGARSTELAFDGVRMLTLDSSEPDLDNGRVGRERHRWVEDRFADPEEFKVVCLHHHLVPVPGTGRERNIVTDAGDFLQVLGRAGADLVLCGHKHVPHVWRLEDMLIVNAGTACTTRVRGRVKPCYNVVEVEADRVKVTLRHPFGGGDVVADMRRESHLACPWRPARHLGELTEQGAAE
ncbi:MAG TPA: metallophosphoesterase [Coriobacteriia bacterium]|jgi:3',5'-cyclic AMP phosphodiesterase CpdA